MEKLIETVNNLHSFLNAAATNDDGYAMQETEFANVRQSLLTNSSIKHLVPSFLTRVRTPKQFWTFIKAKFSTYAERRTFLDQEFQPLQDYLELDYGKAIVVSTSETLDKYGVDYINSEWQKALTRKKEDPEGAITSSRSLIEATCKYILEKNNVEYDEKADLPKLYKQVAEVLNLAPSLHTESIFKQILGGCQTVIEGMGALRNKLGDAHGKTSKYVKPSERHAELVVNLTGTMTKFLLETFEYISNRQKS